MRDLDTWRGAISAGQANLVEAQFLSLQDLEEEQRQGAKSVRLEPVSISSVRTITGVDVQYSEGGEAYAAAVSVDRESLEERERSLACVQVGQTYEFGFLGYRELPAILEALAGLTDVPDLILYDGNGTLHPRGFGAASQLGVMLNHPVIGVSKNVSSYRPFPETHRGEMRTLDGGKGALLVTSDGVKPIGVSPGNAIDLASSLTIVLDVSRYRHAEPLRIADKAAREHCASAR